MDIEKTGVGWRHPQERTVTSNRGWSFARGTGENQRLTRMTYVALKIIAGLLGKFVRTATPYALPAKGLT
jgi:hypothetical protein